MGRAAVVSSLVATLHALGIDGRDAERGCYRLHLWVIPATLLRATAALARRSKAGSWVINYASKMKYHL